MGVTSFTVTPSGPPAQFFASGLCDLMLCWSRGLSSKRMNTSTRRHSRNFTELKVKTVNWPLSAPCISDSTARKRMSVLAGVMDPA